MIRPHLPMFHRIAHPQRLWWSLAAFAATWALAVPLMAQTLWMKPTVGAQSGKWGDPANWTSGIPDITVDAIVSNAGEAAIAGQEAAAARFLYLGNPLSSSGINFEDPMAVDLTVRYDTQVGFDYGIGNVRISDFATGRTVTFGRSVSIGFRDGSLGRFYQDRGTVAGNAIFYVGNGSNLDNEMILEGDADFTAQQIRIGDDANTYVAGRGTVRVRDNAIVHIRELAVASNSSSATGFVGLYEQSGGEVHVTYDVGVGGGDGSDGKLNLSGGLLDASGNVSVGESQTGYGAMGAIQLFDGTFRVGGDMQLALGGNHGYVDIGGGNLDIAGDMILGYVNWGDAVVEQTGGDVSIDGSLIIGRRSRLDNERRYQISDGSLNVGGSIFLAAEWDDQGRENHFDVVGSLPSIHSGGLTLGSSAGYAAILTFKPDTNGVSAIDVEGAVDLNFRDGERQLRIELLDAPPKTNLVLINNDGSDPINGIFDGLPDGSEILASFGTEVYRWEVSYDYDVGSMTDGSGNDLALLLIVPEPSALSLAFVAVLPLFTRRPKRS